MFKIKSNRNPYDFYATPHWCYEALNPFILKHHYIFTEPCSGDSRITNWYRKEFKPSYIYQFDIRGTSFNPERKVDFLKEIHKSDIIITNPPYSLAFEFTKKCVRDSLTCILLLRLNFLASQTRKDWFSLNEPTGLYVLSKRPSFTPDKKTDMTEYAWFVWDKTESTKRGIHHI